MKRTILTVLLCGIMVLGTTACGNNDLQEAKKDLEKTYEKYGFVEQENISTMVAKFNTEIMDNGLNTPAYDDYLTIKIK